MEQYVRQVKHNENFHDSVCKEFSDLYFDWKIICLFYSAYHLIQAFAAYRGVFIGDRHHQILWNLNPKNPNRPTPFKAKAFEAYDQLFEYSRTARYSGFTNFEDFQIMKKIDYEDAKLLYDYLKAYITHEGVIL
jgi:hypothetical protein